MKKLPCSIDPVVFALIDNKTHVLLRERDKNSEAFPGVFALPGGLMSPEEDKDLSCAANRILRQKTGLQSFYFEQLGAFGPHIDPRGPTLVVAYMAVMAMDAQTQPLDSQSKWFPIDKVLKMKLPFEHNATVKIAVERLRNKVNYSSLPAHLIAEEFTLPQLQKAYESVLDIKLDKSAFRKKIAEADFIEKINGKFLSGAAFRPAQVYRLKLSSGLHNFSSNLRR